MKITNIRGKDYIEVAERIKYFNENNKNGMISTQTEYDGNYVRCKAFITPNCDQPTRYFTGHAEEDRTQGNINKTNATENCETSAVGRALAMMGIGIVDSIASADEVVHALEKQEAPQTAPSAPQSSVAPKAVQSTSDDICKDCGANRVLNPKTGKVFCEKKCWLQPKAELPVIQQEAPEGEVNLQDIPF